MADDVRKLVGDGLLEWWKVEGYEVLDAVPVLVDGGNAAVLLKSEDGSASIVLTYDEELRLPPGKSRVALLEERVRAYEAAAGETRAILEYAKAEGVR